MAKKKRGQNGNSGNGKSGEGTQESPEQVEAVVLPLARQFPPHQVGVLSNHFVIQRDGSEFHLLFFQTQPPTIIAESEEEKERLIEPYRTNGVPSICVARIIVSADRMPAFVKAMQDNLGSYQASQEKERGADE